MDDDDDWMTVAGYQKNQLKSDVNSRLKSDLIRDIDFSSKGFKTQDKFVKMQQEI